MEHRRLTALHELCHLLYNKYFSEALTEHQKENLCNAFANEMLLPSVILQTLFEGKQKIAIAELISLGINFGISVDAIVYKLISTSKAATLLGVSINKVRNSATAI